MPRWRFLPVLVAVTSAFLGACAVRLTAQELSLEAGLRDAPSSAAPTTSEE